MECRTCGDPGVPSVESIGQMPTLTPKQLVDLACAIARVGAVLCDLGQQQAAPYHKLNDPPYIWDIKEN